MAVKRDSRKALVAQVLDTHSYTHDNKTVDWEFDLRIPSILFGSLTWLLSPSLSLPLSLPLSLSLSLPYVPHPRWSKRSCVWSRTRVQMRGGRRHSRAGRRTAACNSRRRTRRPGCSSASARLTRAPAKRASSAAANDQAAAHRTPNLPPSPREGKGAASRPPLSCQSWTEHGAADSWQWPPVMRTTSGRAERVSSSPFSLPTTCAAFWAPGRPETQRSRPPGGTSPTARPSSRPGGTELGACCTVCRRI